jgi:hypothetical protein
MAEHARLTARVGAAKHVLPLLAVLVCVPSQAALAEPIRITGGFISFVDFEGAWGVLNGPSFSAVFDDFPVFFDYVNDHVKPRGSTTEFGGTFRLKGQSFDILRTIVTIASPLVPLTPPDATEPTLVPFRFTGTLFGFDPVRAESSRVDLVGQGTVWAAYGHPSLSAEFTFLNDAPPIPEPGTILLFGVSAAGLLARLRKRST